MTPFRFLVAMLGGIVLSWGMHSVLPQPAMQTRIPEGPQSDLVVNDANEPAPENDIRDLRQALARLTSRVISLENRLQTQPQLQSGTVATDFVPTESVEASAPILDEAVLAEQSKVRWDNYLSVLETSFRDERTDTAWATETRAEIEEILASDALTGSVIFGLECHATLCRIEALHDGPQALQEFSSWLPQRLADKLPQAIFDYYEQADGMTVTTVFLAREGYDLPGPPTAN